MPELEEIYWQFMDRTMFVSKLSDKVAYSFTCYEKHPFATAAHGVECLWIWHYCDMSVAKDQESQWRNLRVEWATGWKPSGIASHQLLALDPLHIEPSIYWPLCCGMHGFVRNGAWEGV